MNPNSFADNLSVLKTKKKIIACAPLYPPVELLHSLGLVPVTLWGLGSFIHSTPNADRHIQNYACSIARHMAELMLSDNGALFNGLLMYNACDTLRNLPEILNKKDNTTFHIHIPAIPFNTTNSTHYLKTEINDLIQELETAFGVCFDREKFFESTKLYRKLKILSQTLEDKVSKGDLDFKTFSDIIMANYFLPVEAQINELESALNNIQALETPVPPRRILLSGILPPPPEVIKAIENAGFIVAGNDIASLKRSYADITEPATDPGTYYSDYYKNHFPCSTLLNTSDKRPETLLKMAKDLNASGVIFIGEKFCEHEYFEFPFLEKMFDASGFKTLRLDISINDEAGIGPLTTRIEAFYELLDTTITA